MLLFRILAIVLVLLSSCTSTKPQKNNGNYEYSKFSNDDFDFVYNQFLAISQKYQCHHFSEITKNLGSPIKKSDSLFYDKMKAFVYPIEGKADKTYQYTIVFDDEDRAAVFSFWNTESVPDCEQSRNISSEK
ncbi:MAG: hypothetical protein H6621_08505 [Halobacteriovoraceae bacterium]|nr:hypothetical protein [Halobacteriovoraceae bacterium]MCB9095093.1 hypothetical protein [Halobacteriovoraceae bacterium]